MTIRQVRTTSDALEYMVECTLATITDLALKSRPPKCELARQISIAQHGLSWLRSFDRDRQFECRAREVADNFHGSVQAWAEQFKPKAVTA